jgi:hypothetical protein
MNRRHRIRAGLLAAATIGALLAPTTATASSPGETVIGEGTANFCMNSTCTVGLREAPSGQGTFAASTSLTDILGLTPNPLGQCVLIGVTDPDSCSMNLSGTIGGPGGSGTGFGATCDHFSGQVSGTIWHQQNWFGLPGDPAWSAIPVSFGWQDVITATGTSLTSDPLIARERDLARYLITIPVTGTYVTGGVTRPLAGSIELLNGYACRAGSLNGMTDPYMKAAFVLG